MNDKASEILDELAGFLDRRKRCPKCGAEMRENVCPKCKAEESMLWGGEGGA